MSRANGKKKLEKKKMKKKAPSMRWKEIEELLRLNEWTQSDLARELDMSPAAVCRWSAGNRFPSKAVATLIRQWTRQAWEDRNGVPA